MAGLGFLFVLAGFVYVLPKGTEGGPTAWRALKASLLGRLRDTDRDADSETDANAEQPAQRSAAKRFGVGIGLMAAGIALLELS